MKLDWYKDCKTEEDKKKRKQELANGRAAFDLLNKFLEDNITQIQKDRLKEDTEEDFYTRQLYLNSKEKVYREVQSLIKE